MKILVINCGSSSIKYQLCQADTDQVYAKGMVSRIGEEFSHIDHQAGTATIQEEVPGLSYSQGFREIIKNLVHDKVGVITDTSEISAVGHRAVHGGATFIKSTIITEGVIKQIEDCIPLAPLHNPANLIGIREAMKLFPRIPHVAVFDTAFHQTMPPKAYFYALPHEYYSTHKIRRYGFHGTSCRYVILRTADLLRQTVEKMKVIICHLGNGITIDAADRGKSIDTSLGFTPMPGVMMGTRCGDIDPGVLLYMGKQLGLSLDDIDQVLNRESGLLGISGVSSDMRRIVDGAGKGNRRCELAIEMFAYQAKKYIGAYAAALGGIDTLVFTAGIGENSPEVRAAICKGLEFLGIRLDTAKNNETFAVEELISSPDSTVNILVIPANEERMIALDTAALAFNGLSGALRDHNR
ncbi:MAG: acetate kinase [Syntrophorhabdales bacterium]|jgi:acetate kinase